MFLSYGEESLRLPGSANTDTDFQMVTITFCHCSCCLLSLHHWYPAGAMAESDGHHLEICVRVG